MQCGPARGLPWGPGRVLQRGGTLLRRRHNHRGPWTEQAIEELKALAGENRSTRDIADTLGRSVEAVQVRARREGIQLPRWD